MRKPSQRNTVAIVMLLFLAPGLWFVSFKARADRPISSLAPVSVFARDLKEPADVAIDPQGNLFVADKESGSDHTVLVKITPQGQKSTFARGFRKPQGMTFDSHGSLYVADRNLDKILKVDTQGNVTDFVLGIKDPRDVAFDGAGNLFISAQKLQREDHDEGDSVFKITPQGQLTRLVSGFEKARGIAFDGQGNLYLAAEKRWGEGERDGGTIFKITPNGQVSAFVGSGFKQPDDVAFDCKGMLFFTAKEEKRKGGRPEHGVLGKVSPSGGFGLLASGFEEPSGIAFDRRGNLFLVDKEHGIIYKLQAPPSLSLDSLPRYTNRATRTLTGRTEAGALVDVTGAAAPASGLADSTGAFTIPLTLRRNIRNDLVMDATGAGGQGLSACRIATATIIHDDIPPAITITFPSDRQTLSVAHITVRGAIVEVNPFTVTVNGIQAMVSGNQFSSPITLTPGPNTITVVAQDAAGNQSQRQISVRFEEGGVPAVDRTVITPLAKATEFLYTGSNPIQRGVAPGTIEPKRAAVLRGKVLTRAGAALPAVGITIANHPEYGNTATRTDGMFDMAVNGGGPLTIRYEKDGYIPAQRQVTPLWQDYAWLPDVVLVPYDTQVTAVDFSAPMQVARGTPVTDASGVRQATLLFPQGTTATMVLPNGTTQLLPRLSVRATEYTVGANGPAAMPALLPPNSGYTYSVEFSADEAVAAGAREVTFSQPIISYTENFLNFPVGSAVPAGFYDRNQAACSATAWAPSQNGRVLRVLSVTGGLADLDIDGSGQAANATTLAAQGITDAERQQLATLYSPSQSLWRVPITHFTPWDYNWPYGPPPDARAPNLLLLKSKPLSCPNLTGGSIIDCQNQALGESMSITGTPFRLHYQSDRVVGYKAANILQIPVSGASLPASLQRIDLEIVVAGQRSMQTLAAAPNQTTTFTWDGKDGYGRTLQGQQAAQIRISYVYPATYLPPAQFVQSFAAFSGTSTAISRARGGISLTQEQRSVVGAWDAKGQGLGGWSLDVQHVYDPVSRVLYPGGGGRRSAETTFGLAIRRVAGTGFFDGLQSSRGDGGPATQAQLGNPSSVAVGPDGSLYIVDAGHRRVRRVGSDGIITTVAGNGQQQGGGGDGGPATQASMEPTGVSLGPDGSLYTAEMGFNRIRRVDPDGIITTVAGTTAFGFSGDGGPATQARLAFPASVVVGPDCSLYIADSVNHRIRRVGPDGIITTVAGIGPTSFVRGGFGGDGGPATQSQLNFPAGLAVGPDGSLYVVDAGNYRVRRIGPDGIITTVAGNGQFFGNLGDGGPATQAMLAAPEAVAFGPDGSLYIAQMDFFAQIGRIRRVGPDGIITTVAGGGFSPSDGIPATQAKLGFPSGVAVGPDNGLYISDGQRNIVSRVDPPLPGLSLGEIAIPSEDGSELYVFNSAGRHLRTVGAITGALRYEFTYDSAGRLTAVVDSDGNVTTIERNTDGNPTAIIGPDGQRTVLTLDADSYLTSITNPVGNAVRLAYMGDGLLTTFINPQGNVTRFSYDAQGRLIGDEDSVGGFKALNRTEQGQAYTVPLNTALNRRTTYQVESLPTGEQRRVITYPNGVQARILSGTDGTHTTTTPNGMVISIRQGPDPRWGMQAPLFKTVTTTTPSGLTSTLSATRSVTLADPNNPFSLQTQTQMVTFNGRTTTTTFNAAARTITTRTPMGREAVSILNSKGRVVEVQSPGRIPTQFTYDNRGRLVTITQGTRTSTRTYDTQGNLATITDPLARAVSFGYDAAERLTTQRLPDGREIRFTYDANDNVTSIIPPGRPNHAFTYTPVDLAKDYTPPDVGAGTNLTQATYNADRQLIRIARPDSAMIDLGYDSVGRLSAVTSPRGQMSYAYHPTTGNLTTVTSPDGGTLSYTYDGSLLTIESWAGTVQGNVRRTYDNNFRTASTSINGGATVSFQYDADEMLIQAGALAISRDTQNGSITGTTLGGVTDTRSYNGFGEVVGYSAAFNAAPFFAAQYTYDNLGRLTQKTETSEGVTDTFTYQYDLAGRLTDVSKNSTTIAHYTYDTNGNRLSYTGQRGVFNGTYDSQDRLTQYGTTTYTYTANGELLSKTANGQTTSFNYDVFGNLMAATLPDATRVDYIIDGRKRRIGKKVNGTLVQGFLYEDGLAPIAELDGNNNVVGRFVYAVKANVPDYMEKGGRTYRIISDHLGSPRIVIDTATGSVIQQMDYDEFGNITVDTNPGFQPFGFAGGIYDRHTKLIRFGARDYDPEIGRWTAKDPIGFAGGDTNLYAYVLNDPLNSLDPMGLSAEELNRLISQYQLAWKENDQLHPYLPGWLFVGPLSAAVGTVNNYWITIAQIANWIVRPFFGLKKDQKIFPEKAGCIETADTIYAYLKQASLKDFKLIRRNMWGLDPSVDNVNPNFYDIHHWVEAWSVKDNVKIVFDPWLRGLVVEPLNPQVSTGYRGWKGGY